MARSIIFSAENNKEVMVLPIVPEISLDKAQKNERFETINNGTLNIPGDLDLIEWSIASVFPSTKYHWLRSGSIADPYKYIAFFDKWRKLKKPVRFIVSKEDGSAWFNRLVLVDSFNYNTMGNGDISYSLELSENR
ncbi:hypothetical protein [Tissierella creatinophila]|uniref:Phage tail protein n=1 Tax=Tissierella creatinophila DSM 6911 TaxID=1123403 RepID=A0A1U7M4J7_TISCR|nr:hypothetical protein [Tissierella creatinophila]OLS02237.1 hypothetical protein TICRE_17890 [Tissierella creatinophila DSM 6911]